MKKLHNAQDAIQQAIEGGWNVFTPAARRLLKKEPSFASSAFTIVKNQPFEQYVFADPLFWQALGKARGWGLRTLGGLPHSDKTAFMADVKMFAHQWLEVRLQEGDETKFWESLP